MMPETVLDTPLLWGLVALQIAMGGFDVIVHHELTERLAWKANAGRELRLHAWRNVFYAVLFAVFAFTAPTGWLAIALLVVLAIEIVITLIDFVEEDMTRKLPATERVLHTLLAINYGAILALIGPQIIQWAGQPTGLFWVDYGWGSVVLMVGSVGVAVFAARDFHTSQRSARLTPQNITGVADLLGRVGRKSVLVTGGTGFVGSALVAALVKAGHDVTVLTRDPSRVGHLATPVRIVCRLEDIPVDQHFDAIVNLAGTPVAGWLWTPSYRRRILASRLRGIAGIRRLVARLWYKPAVIIGASAVGAYGARDDEMLTEADRMGPRTSFSARSCRAVERAMAGLGAATGTRVVTLRIGLVLGRDGGLLGRMLPAFDLGLGGPIGSGRQWMSWIALADLVRLIAFAITSKDLSGVVNATAPHPVRNAEFARALGQALGRPAIVPLPALPLRVVLGAFAEELLLTGQRVLPLKAEAAGFRFQHRDLEAALADTLGAAGVARVASGQRAASDPAAGLRVSGS
ncbi:MAG: TIGR01777 family oxidoreductase [Hyphomicrobiaceae bacterium]|nr:TIGR01777 family oxidoreductase [Hyphomicrobiaceae bacterium]